MDLKADTEVPREGMVDLREGTVDLNRGGMAVVSRVTTLLHLR